MKCHDCPDLKKGICERPHSDLEMECLLKWILSVAIDIWGLLGEEADEGEERKRKRKLPNKPY